MAWVVLVVRAARPFKHAFPGVKTVPTPPSRIAEWGKPRDKSLDPHLAAAPPQNHSKHRGFVPDSPALSRIVPHPKTFVPRGVMNARSHYVPLCPGSKKSL